MGFLGCYYFWRGRRLGPVSCDEINRLVESGMLRQSDAVLQAWQDCGDVWFYRTQASEAGRLEIPVTA